MAKSARRHDGWEALMIDTETEKALLGVMPVLAGVLATGLVGSGLGYWWNVQLKRREADLTTIRAFHDLT